MNAVQEKETTETVTFHWWLYRIYRLRRSPEVMKISRPRDSIHTISLLRVIESRSSRMPGGRLHYSPQATACPADIFRLGGLHCQWGEPLRSDNVESETSARYAHKSGLWRWRTKLDSTYLAQSGRTIELVPLIRFWKHVGDRVLSELQARNASLTFSHVMSAVSAKLRN